MSFLRLALCVGGVYSMFLIWAIAQERLSVPFPSTDGSEPAKFKFAFVMSLCQSVLSALSSFIYIMLRRESGQTLKQALGLEQKSVKANGHAVSNGTANPSSKNPSSPPSNTTLALILAYFRTSLLITAAAPFGFAALSHISYPAMVLGKSCKLIPVLLVSVVWYGRRFAPHKYLVVAMVTTGITVFMFFGKSDGSKHSASSKGSNTGSAFNSLIGLLYLLINLGLDGAINSTQDELFSRHKVSGQQMMFFINVFGALISAFIISLPLPFIESHPSVIKPLLQFAFTGSLGQLFIFETLQHFGSLTLVMITLTRKMFTMILSVVVYNHTLSLGQWIGAGIVFAGISVEAWVKRNEIHTKRVVQQNGKARIKQL